MKIFQKVVLGLLTSVVIIIGYSSTRQSTDVSKIEAKNVPNIINVALVGSDARSKDENGRFRFIDDRLIQSKNQKSQVAFYYAGFLCSYPWSRAR